MVNLRDRPSWNLQSRIARSGTLSDRMCYSSLGPTKLWLRRPRRHSSAANHAATPVDIFTYNHQSALDNFNVALFLLLF